MPKYATGSRESAIRHGSSGQVKDSSPLLGPERDALGADVLAAKDELCHLIDVDPVHVVRSLLAVGSQDRSGGLQYD